MLVLLSGLVLAGCGGAGVSGATGMTGPVVTSTSAATNEARAIFLAGSGSPGAMVDEVRLIVEIARTPAEKGRGLMKRRELAADHGMVFIWDIPVNASFWMKDTLIPLSIAFISVDGVVLDIEEMTPQSLDHHSPGAIYTKAVEANQGFFSDHGVKVGDRVRFEGL